MNPNYFKILKECSETGAQLVAVSKTRTPEQIIELYEAGQRVFGENRVQELMEKQSLLPKDIRWHLIGHLQTNKVKQVLPLVEMIHAVDSLKLLREIEKEARAINKPIQVLLQMHVAQEETKFGLTNKELVELLDEYMQQTSPYAQIVGIMGMATHTEDMELVRKEFQQLKQIFLFVKNGYFIHTSAFCELSMGMSHDYTIALEEGSTLVRVGSLLF